MARYGLAIAKLKSQIAVTHERVFGRKRFLARAYASTGTCARRDALSFTRHFLFPDLYHFVGIYAQVGVGLRRLFFARFARKLGTLRFLGSPLPSSTAKPLPPARVRLRSSDVLRARFPQCELARDATPCRSRVVLCFPICLTLVTFACILGGICAFYLRAFRARIWNIGRCGRAVARLKRQTAAAHARVFRRKRRLARAVASTGIHPGRDALSFARNFLFLELRRFIDVVA